MHSTNDKLCELNLLRHYYTLAKFAEELHALKGAMLVEAFTQEKDSAVFAFAGSREQEFFLEVSLDSKFGAIYLRSNFHRARKNTMDIFPSLIGARVQEIFLHPEDRIITITFEAAKMYCVMFSGGRGNIFVTGKSTTVIDAFLMKKKFSDQPLEILSPNIPSFEDFPPETKIFTVIAKCDAQLGNYYAEEFFSQKNIDKEKKLAEFSTYELEEMYSDAWSFRREICSSKKFFLLKQPDDSALLSLIPLKKYPEILGEFDSVSEAIQRAIVKKRREENFSEKYSFLKSSLEKQKRKFENALRHMAGDEKSESRSGNFRSWAELLLQQPNRHARFGEKITVWNWEGVETEIPLDPKKTILENANSYFDRAKNAEQAKKIRLERIPKYEQNLKKISSLLEKLSALENFSGAERMKELEKIYDEAGMEEPKKNSQTEQKKKFREFTLEEGYLLYVGRNAANNDELTMKFAKPNDLWLHARGSAGSHAVLKLPDGKKPPKRVLEQAAEITAYYSQARNAKYTPVAYTLKKNVRKPKGANTGAVVIDREEVIMVTPRLPEGSSEES